jgi:hypothetical protein
MASCTTTAKLPLAVRSTTNFPNEDVNLVTLAAAFTKNVYESLSELLCSFQYTSLLNETSCADEIKEAVFKLFDRLNRKMLQSSEQMRLHVLSKTPIQPKKSNFNSHLWLNAELVYKLQETEFLKLTQSSIEITGKLSAWIKELFNKVQDIFANLLSSHKTRDSDLKSDTSAALTQLQRNVDEFNEQLRSYHL